MKLRSHHFEEIITTTLPAPKVFAIIDDHNRLSAHMNKSNWMMGGGKMTTTFDADRGQKVSSHIQLAGKVFGITLSLDEVITTYAPPHLKVWETVGEPKLIVIGSCAMGVEITDTEAGSRVRLFIDYDLPKSNPWLGKLFGPMYAKWCIRQMLKAISPSGEVKKENELNFS